MVLAIKTKLLKDLFGGKYFKKVAKMSDDQSDEFFDALETQNEVTTLNDSTKTHDKSDLIETERELADEEDVKDCKIKLKEALEKLKHSNNPLKSEFINVLTSIHTKIELYGQKFEVHREESEVEISETIEETKTSILSIADDKVQCLRQVPIKDKDQTFEEFRDPRMNFKQTVRLSIE